MFLKDAAAYNRLVIKTLVAYLFPVLYVCFLTEKPLGSPLRCGFFTYLFPVVSVTDQ
jgi:hypothetical protein